MAYMIGVDVGGTFTDFSVFDSDSNAVMNFKRSSTPWDPSVAIVTGIEEILEEKRIDALLVDYLAHGTTVATNALIEKKGACLGLITTKGFRDLMEIGWQKRPSLYDLKKKKPVSLIPEGLCQEVDERVLYDGTVERPLNEKDVYQAVDYFKKRNVQSIAVCTLFSFINPVHEIRIKEIIKEEFPEAYITLSSELIPEFREYARMSTTVLNSYLGPVMEKYVHNFEASVKKAGITVDPFVTQSNGSVISISETIECPIKTAVSGPSAGVIGAANIGSGCGIDKIITFDMGGTSADISLIENGTAQLSNERLIEGYPARIPMIDINTVGAGGGSIAFVDEGGALKVGPRSAGASPGPACYKRGGILPTVTDANIILGKLNPSHILGGRMEVDRDLAVKAVNEHICSGNSLTIDEAAAGIISVVNSNMVRAIRVVSVEKGYDPREFTLMAFGGAGPLHACEVARDMGISTVLVPSAPGTLCSVGLLMADTQFDLSRTNIMPATEEYVGAANKIFKKLIKEGDRLLDKENVPAEKRKYKASIDCRYEGQNYEIRIDVNECFDADSLGEMKEAFNKAHERSYGYCDPNKGMQMVNFRLSAVGDIIKPSLKKESEVSDETKPLAVSYRNVKFDRHEDWIETSVYDRSDIRPGMRVKGPAIIEQMDSTTVIPPEWTAYADGFGNLIMNFQEGDARQ